MGDPVPVWRYVGYCIHTGADVSRSVQSTNPPWAMCSMHKGACVASMCGHHVFQTQKSEEVWSAGALMARISMLARGHITNY